MASNEKKHTIGGKKESTAHQSRLHAFEASAMALGCLGKYSRQVRALFLDPG